MKTSKRNRRGWMGIVVAGVLSAVCWAGAAFGGEGWVGQEVAKAREGRMATEVAVEGMDVFWGEWSPEDRWYVKGALREWDRGYLVDLVDEETSLAGTPYWSVGCFEPVPTADGVHAMFLERENEWRKSAWMEWRPVGGEPVAMVEEIQGTSLGESVTLHGLETGRVYAELAAPWWRDDGCQRLVDVTDGELVEIYNGAADGPSEEEAWEWGWTGNYYATFEFLPNAVWWRPDGRSEEDGETGEWVEAGSKLAVLESGETKATTVEGVSVGTLTGVDGSRWLWTEAGEGGARKLVASQRGGTGRTTLSEVVCGASGLSGGSAFWEERTAAGARLVREGGAVLDDAEGEGPLAATEAGGGWFRAVAYRGGVAWLHPGTAEGEVRTGELRVNLGGKTWTVADGVLCEGGSPVNPSLSWWEKEGWSAWGGGNAFRAGALGTRLVFERVATGGGRELCTWDGGVEGDAVAVLAKGYTPGTPVVLSLGSRGAAAAVNYGTLDAPDCRIWALMPDPGTWAPAQAGTATEMVPTELDVAAALGVSGLKWSAHGPLPEGLELGEDGVLRGKARVAGKVLIRVAGVAEDGTVETWVLELEVEANENLRPVVDSATPEGGVGNFGGETDLSFSVVAHDPEGAELEYRWFVDGEETGETGASFTLSREEDDTALRTVRCEVSDDLWNEGNVAVVWTAGVLRATSVEASAVHTGQKTTLSVEVEASDYECEVQWHSRTTGAKVGEGTTCRVSATAGDATFYAVLTAPWGARVVTADVVAELDPSPAAGRAWRLTGPPRVGGRCILHAGAWGEEPLECTWLRDGVAVGTGTTLRIEALAAADFGEYALTVKNARGEAAGAAVRVEASPAGTVVGWGADAVEGAVPTNAVEGAVQVAALPYGGVALLKDGRVAAWNAWDTGVADVPEGLSGVEQVATTRGTAWQTGVAAAVLDDGTVESWGTTFGVNSDWDEELECDVVTGPNDYEYWQSDPTALEDVAQVAVGSQFGVALHGDGRVSVWTEDEWVAENLAPELAGIGDAVRVAAEGESAVVWHDDGTLTVHDGSASGWECPAAWNDARDVAGAGSSWSYVVVDADGGVQPGEDWMAEEAMAAIVDAVALARGGDWGGVAILREDGTVTEFTEGAEEGTEAATRAFGVSAGARHVLAVVAGEGVDAESADYLAFAAEYGLAGAAEGATEMERLREACADGDGDGLGAWEEYVAGTDPTDLGDVFKTGLAERDGALVPVPVPDLGEARVYVAEEATSLQGEWGEWTGPGGEMRFYRMKVALPGAAAGGE